MLNFVKKIIKMGFNQIGLDIVRISKQSLLGLTDLPIRTIIDVGANTGQFARMILKFFPNAHLYCFEPLPIPFSELNNWAANQGARIKVFNIAIGDNQGMVEMICHSEHSPSSSFLRITKKCEKLYPFTKRQIPIQVELTTMDNVVADLSVPLPSDVLIKLDVQGYEDRVIKGGYETFSMARACILEVCLDHLYEDQATFKDISSLLYDLGYHYIGNLSQQFTDDGHVYILMQYL